jgi:hypothetical protein
MVGALLAGASSVLQGAGGLSGLTGSGGGGETSSASTTTTQTLTTGSMAGGGDKMLLVYVALGLAAVMILSGKWRLGR